MAQGGPHRTRHHRTGHLRWSRVRPPHPTPSDR